MVRIETARDEAVILHEVEPLGEARGRDPFEGGLEVLEAPRPPEQVTHDQEGPPITHHFQRLGHRAGLIVMFWHRLLSPLTPRSHGVVAPETTVCIPHI